MLSIFLQSFPIGVLVAMPVGAMCVLCVQRTLARGAKAGLATGSGITTAHALYAAVAALGLGAVSRAAEAAVGPLRVLGGVILLGLGVAIALKHPGTRTDPKDRSDSGAYMSALALTLTNPSTVLAFVAVFAASGLGFISDVRLGWLAASAGVAAGSLVWWVIVTASTVGARRFLSDAVLAWLNRVAGTALAVLGVAAIWTGARHLASRG